MIKTLNLGWTNVFLSARSFGLKRSASQPPPPRHDDDADYFVVWRTKPKALSTAPNLRGQSLARLRLGRVASLELSTDRIIIGGAQLPLLLHLFQGNAPCVFLLHRLLLRSLQLLFACRRRATPGQQIVQSKRLPLPSSTYIYHLATSSYIIARRRHSNSNKTSPNQESSSCCCSSLGLSAGSIKLRFMESQDSTS